MQNINFHKYWRVLGCLIFRRSFIRIVLIRYYLTNASWFIFIGWRTCNWQAQVAHKDTKIFKLLKDREHYNSAGNIGTSSRESIVSGRMFRPISRYASSKVQPSTSSPLDSTTKQRSRRRWISLILRGIGWYST